MKKILIAPNSFKGCADSVTLSDYFRKNLKDLINFEILSKPISDGGDGFLEVCRTIFNLKDLIYSITTPFDNSEFECIAGYDEKNRIIYIESAKILGLTLIPSSKKNPINLSSKGMGDLLKKISIDIEKKKIKADKVIIGIGGTGTNDLGLGALSGFGLKLFSSSGKECEVIPKNFPDVKNIVLNKIILPFKLYCVIDVENPLLGNAGASRTFAGQKGAAGPDIEIMEEGFNNLINIFTSGGLINDPGRLPGAGGGLAAGLSIFFNASIINAEDFIMKDLGLQKLKNKIDFLVTGEGSFDSQSVMKKGAWILIREFRGSAEKIFLCCGEIEETIKSSLGSRVIPIEISKFFSSKEESIDKIENGIESACSEIKRIIHAH